MGQIRISGSGAGVCSEQSCGAGAARGWFLSLSVSGIPGRDGESDSLWELGRGAVTCLSQAATGERALLGALGTNHSVGTAKVSQQLPLPWATPGAEGTPAGLGGQVPYFHHARNPEIFVSDPLGGCGSG